VLPGLLLNAPLPQRTEAFKVRARAEIQAPGGSFTSIQVQGGEGRMLELWHLRRPAPKGAVIYLHGFGDDVWGTLGRARSLPEWDAVGFTFRGRDADPSSFCTLGRLEILARLAERFAISRAGQMAAFDPAQVSPARSADRVKSRMALITGDADRETPLAGVQRIARYHPDLTIIPGAGHCEASNRLPGGWEAWARVLLKIWGL
jgi:hypothetical protein